MDPARRIDKSTPAGERVKLASVLPLSTPYMVEIFPVYACNLKCNYCMLSTNRKTHGYLTNRIYMEYETFEKYACSAIGFGVKTKVLRFAGLGEPLLNDRLADMVELATNLEIVDEIEILTNGTLLDHETAASLLKSGVTRFIISIQGVTKKRYKEISGAEHDPRKIADNIEYLYKHRGNAKIYVKIVDTALQEECDADRFYKMFEGVCDMIAIERTVPIHPTVDYGKILDKSTDGITQFGCESKRVNVCPRPFMSMHIVPDGNVVPCYSLEYPTIVGNINNDSVVDIWNGEPFGKFRIAMLNDERKTNEICRRCKIIDHRIFKEEYLDNDIERLRNIYGEL